MAKEIVTSYFNTERHSEDLAMGFEGGWRIQTEDGRYSFVSNFGNRDEAEEFIGTISDEGIINGFDLVIADAQVYKRGMTALRIPVGAAVWQRSKSVIQCQSKGDK